MSRRLPAEIAVPLLGIGVAIAIRIFLVSPFFIPSESMLPTLLPGDLLLAGKWPFRTHDRLPRRGDIVMVRPPGGTRISIKRVIGLPGDMVALRGGVPILNGKALPRWRVADLLVPVGPHTPCRPEARHEGEACRYRRYREMPPNGHAYDVLDLGRTAADDRPAIRVPAGRLYLLGDNRDRSADSRVSVEDGGIGLVPVEDVIARPVLVLLSTDGGARLDTPSRWWRSVRRERIGMRF